MSRFNEQLAKWESTIEIPYPQRSQLLQEMEGDIQTLYDVFRKQGMSDNEAYEKAVQEFALDRDDIASIKAIHAPSTQKLLNRVPDELRNFTEFLFGIGPLIILCTVIQREAPIMELLRNGGSPGMYVILLAGIFLLGRELIRTYRLLVLKDHSEKNLAVDTQSVLIACLSLLLFGAAWSMTGLYATAEAAEARQNFTSVLVMGAKESLIPFVGSLFICSLVTLAHYGTRTALRSWKAPIT